MINTVWCDWCPHSAASSGEAGQGEAGEDGQGPAAAGERGLGDPHPRGLGRSPLALNESKLFLS